MLNTKLRLNFYVEYNIKAKHIQQVKLIQRSGTEANEDNTLDFVLTNSPFSVNRLKGMRRSFHITFMLNTILRLSIDNKLNLFKDQELKQMKPLERLPLQTSRHGWSS